ncbi:MAG TPA: glycoside hydrolase [Cellvibrionaceae bacterium]
MLLSFYGHIGDIGSSFNEANHTRMVDFTLMPPLARTLITRFFRFFRRLTPRRGTASQEVHVVIAPTPLNHRLDKCYLSFSIDISVLAGGFWWEGGQGSKRGLGTLRIPPLSLSSRKLDTLVQALGPSYLRIGGSEADKIHYFTAPAGEPDALVLTQKQWDRLHAFVRSNDLRLIFTVKYGLFTKRQHGNWCGDEITRLLEYSVAKGYRLDVLELGNELNAYWAFHGFRSQPRAKHLAIDYATFISQVRNLYPKARISGPGSAFWPRLGETLKPYSNITRRFLQHLPLPLDILNWHYYPFQSSRSPVRTRAASVRTLTNPQSFTDFGKYSQTLNFWRERYQPGAELWCGETGSAQCGGQPQLSDRFISCFWWADQLAQGALYGHKVMVRQSLIGGDYGLIDRLTLKPRPDYWLSWLWGRLMGEQVFTVFHSDRHLRVYCHSHPTGDGRTLMIINLRPRGILLKTDVIEPPHQRYTLTAKRLTSRKVFINGERPKLQKGKLGLEDFTQPEHSNRVPGYSISFWCF